MPPHFLPTIPSNAFGLFYKTACKKNKNYYVLMCPNGVWSRDIVATMTSNIDTHANFHDQKRDFI